MAQLVNGHGEAVGLGVSGIEFGRGHIGGEDTLPADTLCNLRTAAAQFNQAAIAGFALMIDPQRHVIGGLGPDPGNQVDNAGLIVDGNGPVEECFDFGIGVCGVTVRVFSLQQDALHGRLDGRVLGAGLGGRVLEVPENVAATAVVVGLLSRGGCQKMGECRLIVGELRGEGLPVAEDEEAHSEYSDDE